MKLKDITVNPGPLEDYIMHKYEENLKIDDIGEIINDLISKGNKLGVLFVKLDQDHSDISPPEEYENFDKLKEAMTDDYYNEIDRVSFISFKDGLTDSHSIYPHQAFYNKAVYSKAVLDEMQRRKKDDIISDLDVSTEEKKMSR